MPLYMYSHASFFMIMIISINEKPVHVYLYSTEVFERGNHEDYQYLITFNRYNSRIKSESVIQKLQFS